MRRFLLFCLLFTIITVLALTLFINTAGAAPLLQSTATPAPGEQYEDIDGELLIFQHSITLGDIGIVIALLLIAGILIIYTISRIVLHYLR